jgi:DNA repair exonuclease SbcCD ATPase subunit
MKKSSLKIRDIVTLQSAFTALERMDAGDKTARPTLKLNYAISKTEAKIKPVIDAITKIRKPLPEYAKFMQEQVKIAEAHAEKKDGKPVTLDNGSRYDIRDLPALEKATEPLRRKYKKAIAEYEKQNAEIEKFLDTEEEIEIHKVALDDLPAEMHRGIFKAIWPMIDEKE